MRIRTAPYGAAACASLPLLNNVKDRNPPKGKARAMEARHNPTRRPTPKNLRRLLKPTKPPAAKTAARGVNWFAEATPSGGWSVDIGRSLRLVQGFLGESQGKPWPFGTKPGCGRS